MSSHKKTTMMFSWSGVLADWQQRGLPTPTEVHLSRIIFPMIIRDYRGDDDQADKYIHIYHDELSVCLSVCRKKMSTFSLCVRARFEISKSVTCL